VKYLCMAYEEEKRLNDLTRAEWDALRRETLGYVEILKKSGHLILTTRSRARAPPRRCGFAAASGPFWTVPTPRRRSSWAGSS